jgi:hypothetical protein
VLAGPDHTFAVPVIATELRLQHFWERGERSP